ATLQETLTGMKSHWEGEKEAIGAIRQINARIEEVKGEAERATRDGGLERAAELRYGVLPGLERDLEAANRRLTELQSDRKMLKEEVDEEDVAEVVSAWTGIPVTRLVPGEMARLLRRQGGLRPPGGRPGGAGRAGAVGGGAPPAVGRPGRRRPGGPRPHPPLPGRAVRAGPPDRQLPVPRAPRRRQDRASPGPGRPAVRRRAGHGPHRHERVRREALGRPAGRGPARVRRLRRGRPADRG